MTITQYLGAGPITPGRLDITRAIASRQIQVKANPFDLLKLRKLL